MVDKLITSEVFGDRRSVWAGSCDDVSLVLNTRVISDDVFVKCSHNKVLYTSRVFEILNCEFYNFFYIKSYILLRCKILYVF